MAPSDFNLVARSVISEYGFSSPRLAPLGNRGGFSGAALWRMKQPEVDLCLRAWPTGGISEERLADIHRLMRLARDKGLTFVPKVLETGIGSSFVVQADRLWDLTTWMPGVAATPAQVTRAQVQAACTALARLHVAWSAAGSGHGPCPGIHRRLEALKGSGVFFRPARSHFRDWVAFVGGLKKTPDPFPERGAKLGRGAPSDPVEPWADRAVDLLQIHAAKLPMKLGPWLNRPLPLQFCLCDIWNDHVLFEGDVVTGLVDFGGVKLDHVAVDLARLLGSLAEDRAELRAAGLEAYSRIRPLSLEEEELVSVLDETGTLVGLMTWLKWLYVDDKQFDDRASAARRLQALVERVERWRKI